MDHKRIRKRPDPKIPLIASWASTGQDEKEDREDRGSQVQRRILRCVSMRCRRHHQKRPEHVTPELAFWMVGVDHTDVQTCHRLLDIVTALYDIV